MGSGESAETADTKLNNTRKLLEKPVQPSSACINEEAKEGDSDVPDAESDTNEDWMFKTFSKTNKPKKKIDQNKVGFDPFCGVDNDIQEHIKEETDISEMSDDPKCEDSGDDSLLDGQSDSIKPQQAKLDCVAEVADKCVDLNQFISQMDQLVQKQYSQKSS